MESEVKFMEIVKASIEQRDEVHFIKIETEGDGIKIPMSEDKPNEVKSAFNKIIARMQNGEFQIELEEIGDDLFSQVANEYIMQLNREIIEIHGEMQQYNLLLDQKTEAASC